MESDGSDDKDESGDYVPSRDELDELEELDDESDLDVECASGKWTTLCPCRYSLFELTIASIFRIPIVSLFLFKNIFKIQWCTEGLC